MSTVSMIKTHELFRSLGPEELDRISRASRIRHFDRGETIFRHDEPGTQVFAVLEGRVEMQLPCTGPVVVITGLSKGDFFGLSPLLGSSRYVVSAVCASSTEVLAMDVKPLREVLQNNAAAGFQVMSRVAQVYFSRYVEAMRRLQEQAGQLHRAQSETRFR